MLRWHDLEEEVTGMASGTASWIVSTTSETAPGTTSGTASGTASGIASGPTSGTASGTAFGSALGSASGTDAVAKKGEEIVAKKKTARRRVCSVCGRTECIVSDLEVKRGALAAGGCDDDGMERVNDDICAAKSICCQSMRRDKPGDDTTRRSLG